MSTSRRTFLQTAALAAAAAAPARSANDKVQVGVIGCGARSQEIMKALLAHPQASITSICDAYTGRIERTISEVTGKNGSKPAPRKDYRDILADKSIDAVIIATPDHWHARMVIDAVEADKDVYCEKPLTFRASEGPEIIAAAKRTGKIVQVGSQPISSSLSQKAKEIVRSGRLGQITMIRAAYNRNTAGGACGDFGAGFRCRRERSQLDQDHNRWKCRAERQCAAGLRHRRHSITIRRVRKG